MGFSTVKVQNPLLEKCAGRKAFGRGFYLTSSKEQAKNFLNISLVKAIANESIEPGQDFGYISIFEVNLKNDLAIHIFEDADADWLHCVAAHRKKHSFREIETEMLKYDVIVGKIAEDTGKDSKDVLTDFILSKTGKALYDTNTKLWCNGPSI